MADNSVQHSENQTGTTGDWIVQQSFSPTDLQRSPEEYAARHAHEWGCFSYHLYSFRDPALAAWIRRFHEILETEGEVEHCRQRYLTCEELKAVRNREAKEW